MIDWIDGPSDVIAVRISQKITGSDLDAIMDRLDRLLERPGKIHVFVETQSIDSFELAGLPSYMTRALPLIGKLNRFGRVAVVADQVWIRWATRLESAILPSISYRTFTPAQRREALSWVKGQTPERGD